MRPRTLDFERDVTREAARGAVDPDALMRYAELRAEQPHGYGPTNQVRTGVNWLHEARAELADCRNYFCWWLEEHVGDEDVHEVLIALRFVALAFDRIKEKQ